MARNSSALTKNYLIAGSVGSACAALLAASVFKGFIPLNSFVGYLSLSLFAITALAAIGSLSLALVKIRKINVSKQNTPSQADNAREAEVVKSLAAPRLRITPKSKLGSIYKALSAIKKENTPVKSIWVQGLKSPRNSEDLDSVSIAMYLVLCSIIEETSFVEEIIIDGISFGEEFDVTYHELRELVNRSNLSFLKIGDIVFTNEANIRARSMTRELTTFFERHAAAELALAAAADASHGKKLPPVSKRSPAEFGLAALPKNVVLKIGAELFNSYQPKAKPANAPDTDGSQDDLLAAQLAEPTGASAAEKIPAEVSELFDAARTSIRAKA